MADKMQPGRFTIRFNMNDPQQQAAVEILNRMGRQKAQFIAQALAHYMDCKCHPQVENILIGIWNSGGGSSAKRLLVWNMAEIRMH